MKPTSKSSPFMGRGTTPCLQFSIPYTKNEVKQAVISFKGEQSGCIVSKWYQENGGDNQDVSLQPNGINTSFLQVTLLQEDTMGAGNIPGFEDNEKIMMSIKLLVADKEGHLSVPYCAPLYTYMGQVLYEKALPRMEETSNEQ